MPRPKEAAQWTFFSDTPLTIKYGEEPKKKKRQPRGKPIPNPPEITPSVPVRLTEHQPTVFSFPPGWWLQFDSSGFPYVALHQFSATQRGQDTDRNGRYLLDLTNPVLSFKLISFGDNHEPESRRRMNQDEKEIIRATRKALQEKLKALGLRSGVIPDEAAIGKLVEQGILNLTQIEVSGLAINVQIAIINRGSSFRSKKPNPR